MIGYSAIASSVSGFDALQRVAGGHDDGVMPGVVGEGDDVGILLQRLGGDADVGAAVEQHGDDFLRARLVQHEVHLGEPFLNLTTTSGSA